MKNLFCLILLALFLAPSIPASRGGWGPAGCSAGSAVSYGSQPVYSTGFGWRKVEGRPAVLELYRDGYKWGEYDMDGDKYTNAKGQPADLPTPVPQSWVQERKAAVEATTKKDEQPEGLPVQNFGVEVDKIVPGKTCVNCQEVTKAEAIEIIERGLPEDQHKQRVTVIGPKEMRDQVVKDLETHPSLATLKGSILVQSYDPTNWAVSQAGFVTTGQPTIYFQDPDGKVLHRQDDYVGGAEQLAKAVFKVRKKDPNYDASKDPDLRKDPPLVSPEGIWEFLKKVHPTIYAGLVLLIVFLFNRNKKESK